CKSLKAPFPYFGGKSRVAAAVWARFGDPKNYVEPFFGSGAILLARPTPPRIETVNDLDCYLANFWRAIQADPEQVAAWADTPVNEAELYSRHQWLVAQGAWLRAVMQNDPDYYHCKMAGWWAWGLSCWIGAGWCSIKDIQDSRFKNQDQGKGTHKKSTYRHKQAARIARKIPMLSSGGQGVNARCVQNGIYRRSPPIYEWFLELALRLRRVRVCCGDWRRVLTPTVTYRHGLTAVFLDPPYSDKAGRKKNLYTEDSHEVAHQARAWALANGDNPKLRIALCGYAGEHAMPKSWRQYKWTARGGYGNRSGNQNRKKERIWYSPHCIK
ncbi:DNA adenine methylase, partial [Planctomycetota bacterium]